MPLMRRPRRSQNRIRLGVRIAAIIQDGRASNRFTKTDLAQRTGLSRQMIAAVESARANPTLDVLAALLDGLKIDLELVPRSAVVVDGPRRHDVAHAACSDYVQRRLESAGWKVAREVRIESGRYIGWIDLLAFDESTGTLLVIEIKTRLDDVGAIERSMAGTFGKRSAQRTGWAGARGRSRDGYSP